MRTTTLVTLLIVSAAASVAFSGCVVQGNTRTGVLEVRWDTSGNACQGVASVRVRVEQSGALRDESPKLACSKGFHSFALAPGVYSVTVQGFDVGDNLYRSVQQAGLSVTENTNTLTPILVMSGQSGTGGSTGLVKLKWTVDGQAASVGCVKLGIQTVTVTVFDEQLAKGLAAQKVVCSAGEATIDGIAPGKVWLQLDGVDAKGYTFYGNVKVAGPVEVLAGATSAMPSAIDVVDLRASINVPWQFDNQKTCGGNNVSKIKIEIRQPYGKILVPMTAADATKPCDLHQGIPFADRVIDLQFIEPACIIPPGVEGLVICGILEPDLDIRAVSIDATTGETKFGGWLQVRDLALGKHSNNDKPLRLQPCGTQGVDCTVN